MIVAYTQDAVNGIAAVDPQTGRQIVNLQPHLIIPPLVALRLCGRRWIDEEGHEWARIGHMWIHAVWCVCIAGQRPVKR